MIVGQPKKRSDRYSDAEFSKAKVRTFVILALMWAFAGYAYLSPEFDLGRKALQVVLFWPVATTWLLGDVIERAVGRWRRRATERNAVAHGLEETP